MCRTCASLTSTTAVSNEPGSHTWQVGRWSEPARAAESRCSAHLERAVFRARVDVALILRNADGLHRRLVRLECLTRSANISAPKRLSGREDSSGAGSPQPSASSADRTSRSRPSRRLCRGNTLAASSAPTRCRCRGTPPHARASAAAVGSRPATTPHVSLCARLRQRVKRSCARRCRGCADHWSCPLWPEPSRR